MESQGLILLADDRPHSRDLLAAELEEAGFRVIPCADGEQAWASFRERRFDLVVTDLRMPRADGMMLLRRIRSTSSPDPAAPVILVSAYGTLSIAVDAGRAGVTDFFPFNDRGVEDLVERVRQVMQRREPEPPPALVGSSAAITDARRRVRAVSATDAPVLIRGPRHAGHDQVAAYIHQISHSSGHSLVVLRCESSPLPASLELGTIHLEGIEHLSSRAQELWLRALVHLEARPAAARPRLIASTWADLQLLSDENRFDRTLAERLGRFAILLPALRDRRQDVPELIAAYLPLVGARLGKPAPRMATTAIRRLLEHTWEENLLELERVLESLVAFSPGGSISLHDAEAVLADLGSPLKRIAERRRSEERRLLLQLYEKHGSYSGVARELGITRNAAKYRLLKHSLLNGLRRRDK
jgi:DNA-binding NtrC family response regulator